MERGEQLASAASSVCDVCALPIPCVFLRALSLCVIENPLMWFWLALLASYEQSTMVMRAEGV